MKFETYVRRLNIRAKIMRLSDPRRKPGFDGWAFQDKSISRRGDLISPVVVCGAGHIQNGNA